MGHWKWDGRRAVLPPVGCLAALLAAGLSSGCVHYQARPLSPDAALDALSARGVDSPELRSLLLENKAVERWPPERWDLASLTWVALFYSPELDVARARWGVARAGVVTAGARPDSSATAALGYNSSSPAGVSPWIPELLLGIPLETAGKRGLRAAEASDLSEAARLDVLSTAWQVRSRVRSALLELFLAGRAASLLASESDLRAESLRLLEVRFAAGEASPNEVTQARIALGQARIAAADASRRDEQGRIALAGVLGLPSRALEDLPLSLAAFDDARVELPAAEVERRALTTRSDVLASLSEYEASQKALQVQIARQYPDITLGPGYQLDQTDNKWTLALGLNLPFNRNKGPIAEAEARRSEAAARFLALQARVLGQVEQAMVASRNAIETAKAADDLRQAIERRMAAAEAARRLGEISPLELLGVRLELAASDLTRLDALGRAQSALGELEDAMQTSLPIGDWVAETLQRPRKEASGHD
jgi:cobalt-zinc-cadmium efflux system outer membrane protein